MSKNKGNNQNNPTWQTIEIHGIPNNAILNFLPPELREEIEKDIKKGDNKNSKLQSEEEIKREKIKYDFNMVNSNCDLKEFIKKLKKSKIKNYGILLYGISGSGKSYLGEYIAQELKMPFIKKRASDLMDKFVGQTEQNIAAAFKEAREKKALLLLDEADSFLQDRKFAKQEYTVASVNELLTQMESHPYPFIMTTNLKERLDSASMRRFIFKIKFDYMKKENIQAGIKTYFGNKYKLLDEQLAQLPYITAGDFKVAKRKIEILENDVYDSNKIFEYLLSEQTEKDLDKGSKQINF